MADVSSEVRGLYEMGMRAWPGITLSVEAFARRLAAHAGAETQVQHAEDLVLAYACAEGDDAAIRLFQKRFSPEIRGLLGRVGCRPEQIPDVEQAVWIRLFIGPSGARPRIAEYGARGSLRGWLRTVTVRVGLDELQASSRKTTDADLAEMLLPVSLPPEIGHLRHTYRETVQRALNTSLAALEPRSRNLLRHYFLDGLSIDRLATLYGIHRATAARQVHGACETLAVEVKRELATELDIDSETVDSIVRLLGSQVERLDITGALQ